MTYGTNTLLFTYDASGTPVTLTYNGTVYYYVTNLQGDVVGIVNGSGAQVVGYTYDAWGRLLTTTGSMALPMGLLNPLRYRGYVYDTETGLYYLQTRYYNPTVGRFINADTFTSTGQGLLGYNMFVYCLNNPVNHFDKGGDRADSIFGWIGEELGKLIYECITGEDHPSRQTEAYENQIIMTQNKMVADTAKTMWDAYQRGYAIQQEAKLMEAQMMVDGAIAAYNFLDETEVIDTGVSGYHAVQAARAFKKSATYFAAPIPTVVDEAFAFGFLVKGLYHSAKVIWEELK